jgi:pteridine reductase
MLLLLDSDPSSQALLARQALALLIALVVIGGLLVACSALLLALRRARRRLRGKPRTPSIYVDAWAESANRLDPDAPASPDPSEPKTRSMMLDEPDAHAESGPRNDPRPDPKTDGGQLPIPPSRPVVVITGGARRVGLAIANTMARAGCDLILTYNTSEAEAEQAAAVLRGFGVEVILEQADLSDTIEVERLGRRIASSARRVDVLIHNASVYEPTPLREVTAEIAMRQYTVNALAPLLLTKNLFPLLSRSTLPGGGSVVAMADMHAMGRPRTDFSAYSMSKAALIEMIRCLARDMAPKVRVNGIAPGVVAFPESGHESTPELQAKYLSRVPLGRSGTPGDAAEVVRWLALEAHYITGEVVRVDGGRWLA